MSPRRLAFWMLALAGVAVGHIAGYALAHPGSAAREAALGGHAYLPVAATVVVPIGVVAALVWAIRTARSLGLGGEIEVRHLVAAQVGLFVVQEIGERVLSGDGGVSALAERGVWFGLVAQVVVAWLVCRSVDAVRKAVRFVCAARPYVSGRVQVVNDGPVTSSLRPVITGVAVGLRAPPVGSIP